MEPTTWTINLIHEIAMTIGAVAAVIAALSSLKNGRTLNGKEGIKPKVEVVLEEIVKPKKKKTPSVESSGDKPHDWYTPPDLN